jgi:hypothetical protein
MLGVVVLGGGAGDELQAKVLYELAMQKLTVTAAIFTTSNPTLVASEYANLEGLQTAVKHADEQLKECVDRRKQRVVELTAEQLKISQAAVEDSQEDISNQEMDHERRGNSNGVGGVVEVSDNEENSGVVEVSDDEESSGDNEMDHERGGDSIGVGGALSSDEHDNDLEIDGDNGPSSNSNSVGSAVSKDIAIDTMAGKAVSPIVSDAMEVDEPSSFESCNRGLLKSISGILSTDEVTNYQGQALVTESLPNRVADKTTLPMTLPLTPGRVPTSSAPSTEPFDRSIVSSSIEEDDDEVSFG